jgi:hypothetical protein
MAKTQKLESRAIKEFFFNLGMKPEKISWRREEIKVNDH